MTLRSITFHIHYISSYSLFNYLNILWHIACDTDITVTGLRDGLFLVRVPERIKDMSSLRRHDWFWSRQISYLIGTWELNYVSFEDNHSQEIIAEVKNEWSSTLTPPIHSHGMDRDNFTFTDDVIK